eukprot:TRINITY_DN562_c0_g1_i1.p1 TRINITY_DN562_c0_g1~~TRINITY_DN562_c0_g1_i1.p1  ORF type:complete len:818 (+),score=182.53 TRINITY_DN562_c0_g1_i1:2-2455(+)
MDQRPSDASQLNLARILESFAHNNAGPDPFTQLEQSTGLKSDQIYRAVESVVLPLRFEYTHLRNLITNIFPSISMPPQVPFLLKECLDKLVSIAIEDTSTYGRLTNEEIYQDQIQRVELMELLKQRIRSRSSTFNVVKSSDGSSQWIIHERLLGDGSFAKVYLGERLSQESPQLVAVKVLNEAEQKQETEALSLSGQVNSDHIVEFLEKIQNRGKTAYVMEYCPIDLLKHMKQSQLTARDIHQCYCGIIEGLRALHSADIVHRDLKPDNIMLILDDETRRITAKITDFTIAKFHPKQSQMDTYAGAEGFMAPEILMGSRYTESVDFYSVGRILKMMLDSALRSEEEKEPLMVSRLTEPDPNKRANPFEEENHISVEMIEDYLASSLSRDEMLRLEMSGRFCAFMSKGAQSLDAALRESIQRRYNEHLNEILERFNARDSAHKQREESFENRVKVLEKRIKILENLAKPSSVWDKPIASQSQSQSQSMSLLQDQPSMTRSRMFSPDEFKEEEVKTPLVHHSVCRYKGDLMYTGGSNDGRDCTDEVSFCRYERDFKVRTKKKMRSLESQRWKHCSAWIEGTDVVLVMGGSGPSGEVLSSVNSILMEDGGWCNAASHSPMSSPRCTFTASVVDGQVVAVGGFDGTRDLDSVEVYNPVRDRWRKLKSMPVARSGHASAVHGHNIVVTGGCEGSPLKQAHEYDALEDKWTALPDMMVGLYGHTAVTTDEHTILLLGGKTSEGGTSCDVYSLDRREKKWTKRKTPLKKPRLFHTSAVVDSCVRTFGGLAGWDNANMLQTESEHIDLRSPPSYGWFSILSPSPY